MAKKTKRKAPPAPRADDSRRRGGQRVSYPGKIAKSISAQLTPTGHAMLNACIERQMSLQWKGMKRRPSIGDVFDGLLRAAGGQLVLPQPTTSMAAE